jgi:glycerol-3-phosphate acyltransferase PlsY
MQTVLWIAVAGSAITGHMFCPWLGFKGGKGVATGLGSVLGVFPILTLPGLFALAVFVFTLAVWRYVSLASIAAAATLPLTALSGALLAGFLGLAPAVPWRDSLAHALPLAAVMAALAAAVIWKHRGNIARLRSGTEPKIGLKRSLQAEPARAG